MEWFLLHPKVTPEHLGLLPFLLNATDERSAVQQLNANYQWGGWRPFKGFTLGDDDSLAYPGDTPLRPVARAKLRDEVIQLYWCSWVAVIQPDRSFEVARLD